MTIRTVLTIMIRCNPFVLCLENRKSYGKSVFIINCVSNFLCIFVQNIFMSTFMYKLKRFLRHLWRPNSEWEAVELASVSVQY
jgi:hypothetical protein